MKEPAKRKEDIVVPPAMESEEDMSPLPMVDKFEKAPVYLLLRMIHFEREDARRTQTFDGMWKI